MRPLIRPTTILLHVRGRANSYPQTHSLNHGSLTNRLPEEKGFRFHFTNRTCTFKNARFSPAVGSGVRDSFHGQWRTSHQVPTPSSPSQSDKGWLSRGCFLEEEKKKMKWGWGGGRCQKSETKKLRHDSKPGCGVARRPGAAAGRRAPTWQGPRRGARSLCLPPGTQAPPPRAP